MPNPNIGNEGKKFSKDYQPENNGRKKGSRDRKVLLERLIGCTLSVNNLAIKQLKLEFPDFFSGRETMTFEELMLLRLAREALMNAKPLLYIREILDRLDGKSTIVVQREEDRPVVDYEHRAKIKEEMIRKAKESRAKRAKDE